MLKRNEVEILLVGLFFEGFFYGVYSGIFAVYIQHQASKRDTNRKKSIVFYSICAVYVLSVALIVADITRAIYTFFVDESIDSLSVLVFYFISSACLGCCDFIAQFILIYRCWIVWGCNIRVVIIPSILTFAFLVIWLVADISAYISPGETVAPSWGLVTTLSGLALSLAVNAIVTGLIVFRIFKVFRQVRDSLNNPILGTTGGRTLRRTILVLVESGMALFSIQLARVVVIILEPKDSHFSLTSVTITAIHQMLTGITPTIILVRTSMGLSFHDEKSMEEVAVGSLRFASDNHLDSFQETGDVSVVDQDDRGDDIAVE